MKLFGIALLFNSTDIYSVACVLLRTQLSTITQMYTKTIHSHTCTYKCVLLVFTCLKNVVLLWPSTIFNPLNPTSLDQLTPEPWATAWKVYAWTEPSIRPVSSGRDGNIDGQVYSRGVAGSIADTAITGQRDISLCVHPTIAGIRVMSM